MTSSHRRHLYTEKDIKGTQNQVSGASKISLIRSAILRDAMKPPISGSRECNLNEPSLAIIDLRGMDIHGFPGPGTRVYAK